MFQHIKSLFKRKNRSEKFIDIDQLEKISTVFETLDKFRKSGLIYIDYKRKIVTISSILSQFFIYDEKSWQNFLHQCHLWATFEFSVSAYRRAYTKAMADAEAKAANKQGEMLDYDARRVARMEAAERFDANAEIEKCPDLQFVVLGASEDNEPLLVARFINGVYTSAPVPKS